LRWEVHVHNVDIGEIIDNHHLNFLITMSYSCFFKSEIISMINIIFHSIKFWIL
jgi:hypothetical protein